MSSEVPKIRIYIEVDAKCWICGKTPSFDPNTNELFRFVEYQDVDEKIRKAIECKEHREGL